jgi:heme/copper-type cytochrome/quinol oxidase subunit 1
MHGTIMIFLGLVLLAVGAFGNYLVPLQIVAEIIANNTRTPLWGYRLMVYSIFALGFLSFLVWAHHMFLPGWARPSAHSCGRRRSSSRFRR